jgi:hypothetical protein
MTAHGDDAPMPPLHHIWRVRVVFVVALSLSAVLLGPGTTQASCGSYVTLRSPGKNAPRPAVTQTDFGQVPPADLDLRPKPPNDFWVTQTDFGQMPPADHSGKPWPCSGPTCSSQPLIPPLTAVPSVRSPGDEASGIAAFTLAAETSSAPFAESLSPLHPLQHPRSIFRPPRLPRHSQ